MNKGFHVKDYGQPVKRYVQTMELKDDPELIAEYRRRHSEEESWKEIRDGIREVGILDMQIFILGTRLYGHLPGLQAGKHQRREVADDGQDVLSL